MDSPQPAETLRQWFEDHCASLYCWLRARFPPSRFPGVEVDDLVQEVWIRANRVQRDRPIEDPRAWLLSIAGLVALELRRGAYRNAAHSRHSADATGFDSTDEITSLTRRLTRDEARVRFFAELDSLQEDERQLVLLHGIEGLPMSTVAERIGIGVEAAHKRWQRLRDRLRTLGSPDDLF